MGNLIKTAWRALRSAPLTSAAAVVLIAVGAGANSAVFTVTYQLLIKPLPYADPSRLVILSLASPDGGMPLAEFEQLRTRLRTTDSVAAYVTNETPVQGSGVPRMIDAAYVSDEFFDVLGVPAARGAARWAGRNDPVIVLSDRAARMASVDVGQSIVVGEISQTTGAVMPPAFAFPSADVEAWLPVRTGAPPAGTRDTRTFRLIARMQDGVTPEQVRADVVRVMREIRYPNFGMSGSGNATVTALADAVQGNARPVLAASAVGSLLVLLVTCANVAMLLMGRAVAKRREAAIRLALGASRVTLIRETLAESFMLASFGAAAGIWLAIIGLRYFGSALVGLTSTGLERSLTGPVVTAAVFVTLLVTLVCGGASALQRGRGEISVALRGAHGPAPRSRRIMALLVAAQIAASIVLLTGTVLLWRTVSRLLAEDPGVDASHALTLRLPLSARGASPDDRAVFVEQVLGRVRSLPGVTAAGVGSSLPPRAAPFQISVRFATPARNDRLRMSIVSVTDGYLEAIGARQASGRMFDRADMLPGAASEVVLSRSAARFASRESTDLSGSELPIRLPPVAVFSGRPRVKGIIGDVKYAGLDMPAAAAVYLPWSLRPSATAYLAVRTTGDPMTMAPTIRQIIRETDPRFPIGQLRSLEDEIALSILDRRLRVVPALGFAAVALTVALVGVFALLSRVAAEGRREFAIRMALGASRGRVLRIMLGRAAVMTAVGTGMGLLGNAAVAGGVRGLLYGIAPHDPLTSFAVISFVCAAAIGAAVLPARHASRVDPLDLLRTE